MKDKAVITSFKNLVDAISCGDNIHIVDMYKLLDSVVGNGKNFKVELKLISPVDGSCFYLPETSVKHRIGLATGGAYVLSTASILCASKRDLSIELVIEQDEEIPARIVYTRVDGDKLLINIILLSKVDAMGYLYSINITSYKNGGIKNEK